MNLGDSPLGAGEDPALVDLALNQTMTYNDIRRATDSSVAGLAIDRGTCVGLLAANSAAYVAALFAIMRKGGVAVPINTKLAAETIAYICADASLRQVFCDAENAGRLPASIDRLDLRLPQSVALAVGVQTVAPNAAETGMVLYTSGSTGTPKGVILSHASQWAMVERMKNAFTGATGIVAAPLYHMNGLLFLMGLLAGGGTVVLMPRFNARVYLQAIHDHHVSVLTGVPTMLSLMLKEADLLDGLDFSSVRAIQVGSAPLSETLIEQVSARFPNARISNGYGTTEAGAGMFGPHPDGRSVPSLALGYPQPHVQVRLTGGLAPGEGVLEVKTPAAMTGYLNLPGKTADKIDTDGWINTGDIMRRDEQGFYYFVGRDDDMFNCGGENIYPGEIERVLEADSRVAESCVIPVPDDVKGHKPVAFIVVAMGHSISEEAVKQIALQALPAYMHPRRVYFLETMPLAGTNKIDRRALGERVAAATDG